MVRTLVILFAGIVPMSGLSAELPAPPVVMTPQQPVPPSMLAWIPGEVRCDGQPVIASDMRRPYLRLAYGSAQQPMLKPLTYRFRIDAKGRPLSITQDPAGFAPTAADIGPSLAVSRFPAGREHEGCSISYTARQTLIAETPVEDLVSYSLAPQTGRLPKVGWDRIKPLDSTCRDDPVPAPLTISYPEFKRLKASPGVRDWSMLQYDLDANGQPVNVRVAYTTRNAALDDASIKAVRASRFNEGSRTGCMYPYWRAPDPLEAPPAPDEASFAPSDAACENRGAWASKPTLIYPAAYRARSVEGWAVFMFDVAPWGATGNIRVLAAEPSAEFGAQAVQVISAAKTAESATGKTGCVERVRFVMDGSQAHARKPGDHEDGSWDSVN